MDQRLPVSSDRDRSGERGSNSQLISNPAYSKAKDFCKDQLRQQSEMLGMLVKNFDIKPIAEPDEDLKAILA